MLLLDLSDLIDEKKTVSFKRKNKPNKWHIYYRKW